MLIASRAQVDGHAFGGGYVEGWTIDCLVDYVRGHDMEGTAIVCRDHGGPWQHAAEVAAGLTESEAMESSLSSFREDIAAGVTVLHIDTSRDCHGAARADSAIRRLIHLYGECHEFAVANGQTVLFEIGIEEQSARLGDPAEFQAVLTEIVGQLTAASLPCPTFVVAQTGTKVVETENRGAVVRDPGGVCGVVTQFADACADVGAKLKAHNVDYLDDHALLALIDAGVDAINVAPEFGVVETRAFLRLLEELDLPRQRDSFLRLAYDSGAWRKWLAPNSSATDVHRSVMAGHYVFGTTEFKAIKVDVQRVCDTRGITIDGYLRGAIEVAMLRYLRTVDLATRGRERVGRF
jgi:hypothetical protein